MMMNSLEKMRKQHCLELFFGVLAMARIGSIAI
jgi:hypothetical protein